MGMGCGSYSKQSPCACNSSCKKYKDCCDDYDETCGSPSPSPMPPSPAPAPAPSPGGMKCCYSDGCDDCDKESDYCSASSDNCKDCSGTLRPCAGEKLFVNV